MNKYLVIQSNKIQCLKCKQTIESTHRHDFKFCKCKSVAVDGGRDYLRRLGNQGDWKELSEYTMPNCLCSHTWEDHHHGVVMNKDYFDAPGIYEGVMAEECEATQVNGDWTVKVKNRCYCNMYEPNDFELIKAIKKHHLEVSKKNRSY